MNSDSSAFYDSLASEYNKVFLKKKKYHDAVDALIRSNEDYSLWSRILDVGSGNGKRIVGLFPNNKCILHSVENSSEMVALLRKLPEIKLVIQGDFCTLDRKDFGNLYDVVLMQWNVIGHLSNLNEAIKLTSRMLKVGGHFIFDFNNPLNFKQYGILNSFRNSLNLFLASPKGSLRFKISHENSFTETNFYRVSYIFKLLEKNSLRINRIVYLNYTNGAVENSFGGQVFVDAIRI